MQTSDHIKNDGQVDENIDLNFQTEYREPPIENLTINLGTNDLPRFSWANHKLNLGVRKAIKNHKPLSNLLIKINKANAHLKSVCKLSIIFRKKKARLRLVNKTRWSSEYLALWSVLNAINKGAIYQNALNDVVQFQKNK